jgi:Flp pilus assembly protein TadD
VSFVCDLKSLSYFVLPFVGKDPESVHEQALVLANEGDLEQALPYFKRAAQLDPSKETYWSNLGVTQMRLNLLDDALVSFTRGSRINPDSSLINENINALQGDKSFLD